MRFHSTSIHSFSLCDKLITTGQWKMTQFTTSAIIWIYNTLDYTGRGY